MAVSVATSTDNGDGEMLVVLAWCLVALSILVVSLRTWTRTVYLGDRLLGHDILMILATVLQIGQTVMLTISHSFGLGQHVKSLAPDRATQAIAAAVGAEPFGVFGPMAGRVSCALLFMDLLVRRDRAKRLILWATVWTQLVVNVYVIVELYAQCGSHIQAIWDISLPRDYCLPPAVETYSSYVQVSVCAATDLILSTMPAIVLRHLRMAKRDRMALICVLSLSIFACAAAIARATKTTNLANADDFTFYFPTFMTCVVIENNVVIVCGSAFTLRPIWRYASGSVPWLKRRGGSRTITAPTAIVFDDPEAGKSIPSVRIKAMPLSTERESSNEHTDSSEQHFSHPKTSSVTEKGDSYDQLSDTPDHGIERTVSVQVTYETISINRMDGIDEDLSTTPTNPHQPVT